MRHDPLYVTSVVQSYIKSPGNCTGRKGTNVPIEPKSHMVKHSISLWQAEKKKSHDHLSVFNEHRDWVFVCERGRARKSTCTAWPVTFDSTSISKLHPLLSGSSSSPPPPAQANDDVTQLTALYGLIIFRYYCYYLPNQWLSSAGLIATAVHQA